jgi:hypothetical protein
VGRPNRSVSIWATSQNAVTWPLNSRAALGAPSIICMARTGAGLPELASAPHHPRYHLGPRPEPDRHGMGGQRIIVAEGLGGDLRVGGAADMDNRHA